MKQYLKSLNEKQLEAVLYNDGPLRLISGAGSGKTRTLTTKIVYLLDELNFRESEILAMTFTKKAAREMKERIEDMLQNKSDMSISTYHKWCLIFLKQEIEVLGISKNFDILSESDFNSLLKKVMKELNVGDVIEFASVKAHIKKRREEEFLDKQLIQLASGYVRTREEIYQAFKKKLKEFALLDYDLMLFYTYQILRDYEAIRIKWAKRYKAILVDEFQDTDEIQYRIVKYLSRFSLLTIVGDPDQTIYTWRGAKMDIILNLEKDFPNMKTIVMNQNYRSTKVILEHSNALISKNLNRFEKSLFTNNEQGESLITKGFNNPFLESNFVADEIQDLLKQGVDPSEIVVFYRQHRSSRPFEDALRTKKVDYQVLSGVGFYERKEIKEIILLTKILNHENTKNDFLWTEILNTPPRGIGAVSIAELEKLASDKEQSIFDTLLHDLDELSWRLNAKNSIKNLFEAISRASRAFKDKAVPWSFILKEYLNEIGYLASVSERKNFYSETVDENIREFFDSINLFQEQNPDKTLQEYLDDLSVSFEPVSEIEQNKQKVKMMTVHGAKGLEFDYVFIVNFAQHSFPIPNYSNGFKNPTYDIKHLEEERRLAYVALTRARKKAYITYPLNMVTEYSSQSRTRSTFIAEMQYKQQYRDGITKARDRVERKRNPFAEIKN
ncbi:ATP-dependent helicase [Mycoplasmopsis agassizii]|uniref:ATP-dependent helicase n=1 Tax=Mycoplasmopsis agassizii TaxID=33922 RepID=UPI0035293ED8